MKTTHTILITGAMLFCSYFSYSQCKMMGMSHSGHDNHESATVQSNDKAQTNQDTSKTIFTCSMHPEIKMDKPGNCPKCGMALIEVKDEVKKEAKTDYRCPMKCEGSKTYDKSGNCPVCGMNLSDVTTEKKKQLKEDEHKGHHH